MLLGELTQFCQEEGIVCRSVHASIEMAKLLASRLGHGLEECGNQQGIIGEKCESTRKDLMQIDVNGETGYEGVESDTEESDVIDTEDVLKQLSEAEKIGQDIERRQDGEEEQDGKEGRSSKEGLGHEGQKEQDNMTGQDGEKKQKGGEDVGDGKTGDKVDGVGGRITRSKSLGIMMTRRQKKTELK